MHQIFFSQPFKCLNVGFVFKLVSMSVCMRVQKFPFKKLVTSFTKNKLATMCEKYELAKLFNEPDNVQYMLTQ